MLAVVFLPWSVLLGEISSLRDLAQQSSHPTAGTGLTFSAVCTTSSKALPAFWAVSMAQKGWWCSFRHRFTHATLSKHKQTRTVSLNNVLNTPPHKKKKGSDFYKMSMLEQMSLNIRGGDRDNHRMCSCHVPKAQRCPVKRTSPTAGGAS